eukprot:gene9251-biopygen2080
MESRRRGRAPDEVEGEVDFGEEVEPPLLVRQDAEQLRVLAAAVLLARRLVDRPHAEVAAQVVVRHHPLFSRGCRVAVAARRNAAVTPRRSASTGAPPLRVPVRFNHVRHTLLGIQSAFPSADHLPAIQAMSPKGTATAPEWAELQHGSPTGCSPLRRMARRARAYPTSR